MWSHPSLLKTFLWQRECAASRACGRKVMCRTLLLQDLPVLPPSARYMTQCAQDTALLKPDVCWSVSVNNKQHNLSPQETAGLNTGVAGRISSWKTKTPEPKTPETKSVKPAETKTSETKPPETKTPETKSVKPAETKTPETKPPETKTPETKSVKPAETKTNETKTAEMKKTESKTPEPKSLKPTETKTTEKKPLDTKTTDKKTPELKTPALGKPAGGKPVSSFQKNPKTIRPNCLVLWPSLWCTSLWWVL